MVMLILLGGLCGLSAASNVLKLAWLQLMQSRLLLADVVGVFLSSADALTCAGGTSTSYS
jgi:hypothetical protein